MLITLNGAGNSKNKQQPLAASLNIPILALSQFSEGLPVFREAGSVNTNGSESSSANRFQCYPVPEV